tara:strand:+ start:76 stop:1041 length:966 start_codon:yes stop_codon:yes gene_type:complete
MATYVNDLRLKEIATGDESGTWGTSTNTNLELIAEAFSFGTEAITTNADTHTTTIADGATDPGRSLYLKYTGALDSACTITLGPNTVSKVWIIENATSGSQNIIIKQGSGTTVTIAADAVKVVYSDGAGSGASVVDAFQDVALGGTPSATNMTITSSLTADAVISSTSVKTPLIEYTDGDDAMTIADGGAVTFAKSIGVGTTASATTGEIRATNNITAYYSSDIGLKENLNPIENSIEKIQAISGYNFDWKDEVVKERGGEDDYFVRKSDVGVVAQEIEAILPEACATRPDGTKAVRYEQLVPLLIEGIKELKAEIEELKK